VRGRPRQRLQPQQATSHRGTQGSIKLHADTPDTPNLYIKHHQGLEYLNMAMAQLLLDQ